MNALVPFDFHGDALQCIEQDGRLWVALRPVCDGIGIDAEGQRQRLSRRSWATTCMTKAVAADGREREVFALDLDSLPMWLATIEPARVRAEVRGKLETYQKECARVLRDHFFGRRAPGPDLQAMESMARLVLQMEERLRRVEDRGRPETPMQKRDAARQALIQWPHLSDRQLARRAGVGATLVGEVREEIGATAKTREGRDNRVRRVPEGTARREQLAPPVAAVLERFGLVVTASMTTPKTPGKEPRPVWNVTGTQREWAPILRDLGGRWYRPAQQWTFFRDPSEELAAAFLAAFPEEVQS